MTITGDDYRSGALVTGGRSDMGVQTARGAVAILDRDPEAASSLASEIRGIAVACDVAS